MPVVRGKFLFVMWAVDSIHSYIPSVTQCALNYLPRFRPDLFVSSVRRGSSKPCQHCNSKESVERLTAKHIRAYMTVLFNPLYAELNPICHLLSWVAAHRIVHVSRVRVNLYLCLLWCFHAHLQGEFSGSS